MAGQCRDCCSSFSLVLFTPNQRQSSICFPGCIATYLLMNAPIRGLVYTGTTGRPPNRVCCTAMLDSKWAGGLDEAKWKYTVHAVIMQHILIWHISVALKLERKLVSIASVSQVSTFLCISKVRLEYPSTLVSPCRLQCKFKHKIPKTAISKRISSLHGATVNLLYVSVPYTEVMCKKVPTPPRVLHMAHLGMTTVWGFI